MNCRLARVEFALKLSLSLALSLTVIACSKPAAQGRSTVGDAAPPVVVDAAIAASVAPTDSPARLRARGHTAYGAKDFVGCAPLFAQAGDHYSAACCYALAGDRERAFAEVDAALGDARFRDFDQLSRDADLRSLHQDARWTDVLTRGKVRDEAYLASINRELYELYQADQGDRQEVPGKTDFAKVGPRDEARLKRVGEILAAGGAKVAVDYYHAAMVYQHGTTPEQIARAHELAVKAVELDGADMRARWLAAAATDRELMYKQQPQRYGTQYQKQNGRWVLYALDPSTTDDERAKWNVPPIAEARARAEAMNAAN